MTIYCPFAPQLECNCRSKEFAMTMQQNVVASTISDNLALNLTEEQALDDYRASLKDTPLSAFENIPSQVTQNCPNCTVAVIMVKKTQS